MLCTPISITGRMPVLAKTSLAQGNIMLRHVQVDTDLPFIIELLKKEVGKNWDSQLLMDNFSECFSDIARSQTSQAFIVKLDDLPLFEIEVYEAQKHAGLRSDFQAEESDYYITLLAGDLDQAEFPVYISGLRLCLKYFSRFPEVEKIIVPLYEGTDLEQQHANLFTGAGLKTFLDKTTVDQPDLFAISFGEKDTHFRLAGIHRIIRQIHLHS